MKKYTAQNHHKKKQIGQAIAILTNVFVRAAMQEMSGVRACNDPKEQHKLAATNLLNDICHMSYAYFRFGLILHGIFEGHSHQ